MAVFVVNSNQGSRPASYFWAVGYWIMSNLVNFQSFVLVWNIPKNSLTFSGLNRISWISFVADGYNLESGVSNLCQNFLSLILEQHVSNLLLEELNIDVDVLMLAEGLSTMESFVFCQQWKIHFHVDANQRCKKEWVVAFFFLLFLGSRCYRRGTMIMELLLGEQHIHFNIFMWMIIDMI